MAVIQEGIRAEGNDKISFGNYAAKDKIKSKLELNGDEYSVKTHKLITRLEKNGMLLLETVPGAVMLDFYIDEDTVSFMTEGIEDTQITLELLPETEYNLTIEKEKIENVKTNRSGKVNFSVELDESPKKVLMERCK